MSLVVAAVVGIAYFSLVVELTLLHVPSVASSRNILSPDPALVSMHSARFQRILNLPVPARVLLFIVPVLLIYGLFALPLIVLFTGANPLDDELFTAGIRSQVIGMSLVATGRAITLWSVLSLRAAGGESRDSGKMHIAGPFRRIRNPGLLGMYIFAAGLWAITPSAAMLAGIVVYLLHMDFKVRMEEDYLGNRFGDVYADYFERTRRYLP